MPLRSRLTGLPGSFVGGLARTLISGGLHRRPLLRAALLLVFWLLLLVPSQFPASIQLQRSLFPTTEHQRRTVVLLLGSHRSGTSGLAHAITDCLHLPITRHANRSQTTYDYPADTDEPNGWFEHKRVTDIQERLLITLKREWHLEGRGLLALPDGWQKWPEVDRARRELEDTLIDELSLSQQTTGHMGADQRNRVVRTLLVKDPRTSLLLPLWHDVVIALQHRFHFSIELVHLLAIRHPNAVAGSIARRNVKSLEFGKQVWKHHVESAIVLTKGQISAIVDYDDAIETPEIAVENLFKGLLKQKPPVKPYEMPCWCIGPVAGIAFTAGGAAMLGISLQKSTTYNKEALMYAGITLLIIGVAALAFTAYTLYTERKKKASRSLMATSV